MPNLDPNSQSRPLWADELLRLWQQPPQPTLTDVVKQLARPGALPDGVEPPSYNVARRYLIALAMTTPLIKSHPRDNHARMASANAEMAVRSQTATAIEDPAFPRPRTPHIRRCLDSLPPELEALLEKELALQDALDDARQALADAENQGFSKSYVSLAGRVTWIRVKGLLCGFWLPMPPIPVLQRRVVRLVRRLRLRWIALIETLER